VSESRDIHWSEDEDLLEQFVLGRLESVQVARLEKHLQECDRCRIAVAKERELAAGIRLAGRQTVKHRLAQRLEQRRYRSAGWYRVAGVAAGIVLLVTIGIYNRWFAANETQTDKQDRTDRIEKHVEPEPPRSPERQVTDAEKPAGDASRQSAAENRQKAPSLAAGAPRAAGAQSGNITDARVDRLKDLKATNVAEEAERREKKDRITIVTGSSTVSAAWVQGIVITERDQNEPMPMETGAKAKDERAVLRKGKEENFLAGKSVNAKASQNTIQNFTVTQKLISDLPASQRTHLQEAASVQTLLQRNPTGTQITVFLDSLLTKKEFDQSRVKTIGEDSIILNIGKRMVGYRLPPDWTGQGVQQTRKEK
jgi:hypothetical protein